MPRKKPKYEETKMVLDIARVMEKKEGPFTKRMLIELLIDIYPDMSYRELMNDISNAIWRDKVCNQRFKSVRVGVWELKERVPNK